MLTYLQGNSRPEMSMAVHQTARFRNIPMLSHEKSIKRLGRYLYHTKKEGIIYNPDTSKILECYVDADLAGDSKHMLMRLTMLCHKLEWLSCMLTAPYFGAALCKRKFT